MSIASYDDLAVEIAAYTHRNDLGPRISTFVQQAESRMDRELEITELQRLWEVTVVTNPYVLELRARNLINVQVNGRDVEYMSQAQLAQRWRTPHSSSGGTAGITTNYTVEGKLLRLVPFTSGSALRLMYYLDIEPLTPDNQANSILPGYPELYLWGCLVEAFRFMQDFEAGQAADQIFVQMIDNANLAAERTLYGDGLQMRAS